ncbi:MBL fold metallo-hydrolase [Candidatus Micrarchaeota archaeon]|nr:MBL fold metallo-hydrolase [Candidatus Micrarchaeota archaeon]MBD3417749.1 MBL fold metallo-hydrolase [Candidatus Micrarchaeota archaeon]
MVPRGKPKRGQARLVKTPREFLAETVERNKTKPFRNKHLSATFLGTASATPTRKRGMPSIAIKYDDLLLWDCGEGCQMEMMRRRIGSGSVKAVFLTHLHLDHFLGVFGLVKTLGMARQRRIDIFAPDRFRKIMDAMEIDPSFFSTKEMEVGKLYSGDQYDVSAFRVKHRNIDSFGLVFKEQERTRIDTEKTGALGFSQQNYVDISTQGETIIGEKKIGIEEVLVCVKGRKIIYSGDTVYDERIAQIAEGADLLIHEATYTEEFADLAAKNGHSTARQAAEIARMAGAKKLVLTHFSRMCSNDVLEREAKELFENTLIAKDGMKVEVKQEKWA